MAKIKFHKSKIEIPKGKEIKSITRFDDEAKKDLLIRQQILLRKQCATRKKAKDIVISSIAPENETNNNISGNVRLSKGLYRTIEEQEKYIEDSLERELP